MLTIPNDGLTYNKIKHLERFIQIFPSSSKKAVVSRIKDQIELGAWFTETPIDSISASIGEDLIELAKTKRVFLAHHQNVYSIYKDDFILVGPTRRIVFDGIDFGPFYLGIGPFRIDKSFLGVHAYPITPYFSNGSGYFHPHVDPAGIVCTGRGTNALRSAANRNDVFSMVDILESILRSYEATEAYIHVHLWDGATCCDCGDIIPAEDVIYCDQCGDELCEGCVIYESDDCSEQSSCYYNERPLCHYCSSQK